MMIGVARVSIHAPWVHSLKEKRALVKGLCAKVRQRFNVSIGEVAAQDLHQRIVVGFACVAHTTALADSIIDHVLSFMESHAQGEIFEIWREIR
jgi:uncharacterized protein YlxP (DUF503 family)